MQKTVTPPTARSFRFMDLLMLSVERQSPAFSTHGVAGDLRPSIVGIAPPVRAQAVSARACQSSSSRYGPERPEGKSVANRREVHRSTHAATSACLPTPVPASRRLDAAPAEIDRLTPDSWPYGPESAFHGKWPADDGHSLRNEGAVGSNPITNTTERLVAPATRRFALSTFLSAFDGAHRSTHFVVALQILEPGWCRSLRR